MIWETLTFTQRLILLKKLVSRGTSGQLYTYTGALPATITAVAHAIASLTRYGLCTQDGTPTPDAPVDIMTNNGPIKVRRQSGSPLLYQAVEWLKPSDAIPITGFKTKSTQEITAVFYRESSGSTYLYWSDTASSGTTNTTAYLTTVGGNWRWDGKTYSIGVSSGIKITSVQNKDGVWLNGTKYASYTDAGEFVSTNDLSLASYTNTTVRIYSVTVREGETVTLDLVPVQRILDGAYGFYDKVSGNFYTNDEATFEAGPVVDDPVEIYTDGEDEVLTVSGKNLYDKSAAQNGDISSTTGAPTTNNSRILSDFFPVNAGNSYAASGTIVVGGEEYSISRLIYALYDSDKGFIAGSRTLTPIGTTTFSVPDDSAAKYARVCFFSSNVSGVASVEDSVFQIERGTTATDFEPYVTPQTVTVPMLLSVGGYKDTAELINGIKKGKVGIKVFDGTEDFTVSSSGAMITTIPDVAIGAENNPMNTRFDLETSATSITVGTQRFGSNGTKIYSSNYYMKHPTITTAPDFKVWLASLFAAGNPAIMVYPRATETTEQITANNLVTHKGVNTVDSTANVTPAEAKIEYYGTEVQMLGMMMPAPSAPEEPGDEPEKEPETEEEGGDDAR